VGPLPDGGASASSFEPVAEPVAHRPVRWPGPRATCRGSAPPERFEGDLPPDPPARPVSPPVAAPPAAERGARPARAPFGAPGTHSGRSAAQRALERTRVKA
jgi:hypothetical protein